jgi:hypothetical protein
MGIALQQGDGAHDLSRLAKAALRHIFRNPGGNYGMISAEPLHGANLFPGDRSERESACAQCFAVDYHRAGAARPDTATVLGSGELELLT